MAQFDFLQLDEETRKLKVAEILADIENGRLYLSDRLNEVGKEKYASYLLSAATSGNEESLENLLDIDTHFNPTYLRQGKPAKMPSNASRLLCQSEFNRYYIRAICRRAIEIGTPEVEIYRARESSWSRPESEAKIGTLVSAKELLEDLRNSIGAEPSLLPEINSGLSVKLVINIIPSTKSSPSD